MTGAGVTGGARAFLAWVADVVARPARQRAGTATGTACAAPLLVLLVVAGAMLPLLGGCSSVGLAYGQAGTLGYWWLDRFADFNAEQAPRVRATLQDVLAWHRRSGALAEDITLLDQLAGELTQDISPAQACAWFERLRQRRQLYTARITGPVGDMAATLEPRQLRRIAERQASRNEDWRDDHLQPRPADRLEGDVRRIRERAEMLYGRLDAVQRRAIVERLQDGHSPWDAQRWYAGMLADQAALQAALRGVAESGGTPATREALAAVLLRAGAAPDATTQAWREQLQAYQCAVGADLHRRTTPAQREAAARTLRGWAQDLRAYLPPGG